MELNHPLINENRSRSIPGSTRGVLVEGKLAGFNLYGVWSDKKSNRNTDEFNDWEFRINPVTKEVGSGNLTVFGGNYRFDNGIKIAVAHGQASGILEQTYFSLKYPFKLSDKVKLNMDATYYIGKSDGLLVKNNAGNLEDYDTDLAALSGQFVIAKKTKITLSYQKVGDHEYLKKWGNDDWTSLRTYHNFSRISYTRADEESIHFRLDHKFASIPGFSSHFRYTRGDNFASTLEPGKEGKEWGRRFQLRYRFAKSSKLKGLDIKWQYTSIRSTNTYASDEHRLIAAYSF